MSKHDTGNPDPPLPMSRAQTPERDQNPLPPEKMNDLNQSQAVVEETDDMDVDSTPSTRNMDDMDIDPTPSTRNMPPTFEKFYCLLELISEQGSGGLVDKVVIAQESLGRFINELRPGAYSSLTKVDFKALDSCLVQPIGVYGSRQIIVTFLLDMCIINDRQAVELLSDDDDMYQEILKPGLYIVLPSQGISRELYIIFWPEKDTWRDDAISSVRRNRVTFIRYLTKITHQILCLFTEEESRSFVWNSETESDEMADDNEGETDDRMFTFEVAKTLEQQEDVTTRPGFVFAFPPGHLKSPSAAVATQVSDRAIVLSGECSQGLLTVHFVKPKLNEEWIRNKSMNSVQLTNFLATGRIELKADISLNSIQILIDHGLIPRFAELCRQFKQRRETFDKDLESMRNAELAEAKKNLSGTAGKVKDMFLYELLRRMKGLFPNCNFDSLNEKVKYIEEDVSADGDPFVTHISLYPELKQEFDQAFQKLQSNRIEKEDYLDLKRKLVIVELLFESPDVETERKDEILGKIFADADLNEAIATGSSKKNTFMTYVPSFLFPVPERSADIEKRAKFRSNKLSDANFLGSLNDPSRYGGDLAVEHISNALRLASIFFKDQIEKTCSRLCHKAQHLQEEALKKQIDFQNARQREAQFIDWRSAFLHEFHSIQSDQTPENQTQRRVLHLSDVKPTQSRGYWFQQAPSFSISAKEQVNSDPCLEYKIHTFELTAEHRQNLQLDPKFVPKPHIRFEGRASSSFQLPINHRILHGQLLSNDKLLLFTDDQCDTFSIFLDSFIGIGNAVKNRRPIKRIRQEKTGKDLVIAFDENKRMLALYARAKASLHIFVFDETFASLQSWGNPLDLIPWYDASSVVFRMCFVTGVEELLLVDNQANARIFSLVTQQFRPATLHFSQVPLHIYPSPDGSCFLAWFERDNERSIRAYHWTTFGSNNGIDIDIELPISSNQVALTSFVNRSSVHLVQYDFDERCWSVVLDITKKATEFSFQEKSMYQHDADRSLHTTVNNSLLDCYYDVWTRFPVLPAVQRHSKASIENRAAKRIICATFHDSSTVISYFNTMIRTFEQKTRKPVGSELGSIVVQSLPFNLLRTDFIKKSDELVSTFYAGEWVVDILCLIPIHLAITRENRFIPLKDGVISAEYERSLLGADVNTVADSISFGWYESILQSYMASKPVKVVSSMGEQSVGKSYSLNHLVDTSFAGSAMRTTEGVWMSVTPTDDTLLVALDFEGVHSIERSAQEDTLLVLFNTAVSNLVLFRNNFALSRDITGLFQSFQSSSTVFDPNANPTLFCSTLVIIIKDVVDSDKKEIVREFKLKFQKIVQEEQEFNFISRLHRGQLNIVPWPVIESKKFYTLFPAIKTQLDKQLVTHGNAGNFLQTMKTLMAKLKANDWRALSQSMAGHRAHRLLAMLQNALAFGYSEIEPHPEPLKDFDTDIEIDSDDKGCLFYLSSSDSTPGDRDAHLIQLCQVWEGYRFRSVSNEAEWVNDLSAYLTHLVDIRVNHVQLWISKNLESFQQTAHANITILLRAFDTAVIDIKANTELCRQQCASCNLFCLLNRRHENRGHDCLTSHKCSHHCDFSEEHPEDDKLCGYCAGHSGKHVCVVEKHLCGEPCILSGKPGCLSACTQLANHIDQEHRCSSRIHACGMPCRLSVGISMAGALNSSNAYVCKSTCAISSETPHDEHVCDNRMCPVKCELCNRLCASRDHLHSLRRDALHLCGEIHSCPSLCSANGICEIDTAPQSIEATFTGRHETFQYTKYSQVAKRLSCIIPIPAMKRAHAGKHCHTTDPKPFHFCETQCLYCGYYCTLPLGHSQQEHETSHGSMSKSRWAVDDPDAVVELNGRKFGSNDDGAPMMCNLFCQEMGRHVHIDYCRAESDGVCNGTDVQHILARLNPNPDRPKDWITHELFWRRSGFKDPYSRDDKTNFAKCDAMCPGPEHAGTASNVAQPSYCTLPLFHAPFRATANNELGYTTQDGHHFSCKNPAVMHQAFHVIFVIDRSGSMSSSDKRPLSGTPVTRQIAAHHNNRLGAVYSSLHSFWVSRMSAVTGGRSQQPNARRDAYSVLLFDHDAVDCLSNDFTSTPDQLLDMVLPYSARGGTNYNLAVSRVQDIVRQFWSTERGPVVVFLSDGECSINDQEMQTLCRAAVALGKPLSFHGVSFGPDNTTLRRMVQIARDIQRAVPPDPLLPQGAFVESSFAEALDSVRLAETFLGLAEALKKPRGALFT